MSSHHIVREKQEPALLIISLKNFNPEWLGQLLEWSPTIIATETTALQLLTGDIYIDWLLSEDNVLNPQATTQVISSHATNWTKDALQLLADKGYPAVNVITDEFAPEAYLPFTDQLNIVIYCQQKKTYAIRSGFEKWKPAGSIISITNPPVDLEYGNLTELQPGRYQVKADGFIKLSFNAEHLFIAEDL